MALLMTRVDIDMIRLVGRWQSDAMSRAMAPPAHIERALTSSGLKPTCGPVMVTAARRDLFILVILIEVHFPLWNKPAKGVWMVDPWCRRYATRRLMAANAHAMGCHVVPWLMDSPLTPFF